MADESALLEALRQVIDPELMINVVDLGLVYRVECREGAVDVDLTMTTPACPAAESIAAEAESAVRGALPDAEVRVAVVYEPPWTPDRVSENVKQRFGW